MCYSLQLNATYQVFNTLICDPHRTWFTRRAWEEKNMPHHHAWLPTVLCSCVKDKARQSPDWTGRWSPEQHTCASGSGCFPRRSPDEEDSSWIAGTHMVTPPDRQQHLSLAFQQLNTLSCWFRLSLSKLTWWERFLGTKRRSVQLLRWSPDGGSSTSPLRWRFQFPKV